MAGRVLRAGRGSRWLGSLAGWAVIACGATTQSLGNGGAAGDGGAAGTVGGGRIDSCPLFPPDNPWNTDISSAEVDPNSEAYLASMSAGSRSLHPDFGSNPAYGIPYVVVSGSQPKVPVRFEYADESDPGPYPIPPNAPIEGGSDATGDRHVLVIDKDNCLLYETFNSRLEGATWACGSGAIFDLRSNRLRPDGWTSADAAGLPIFSGLVRYDEAVEAGEIRHALRFTARRTQNGYVTPATHAASNSDDPKLPPMGLRVRLKAGYDISQVRGASKAVLTALKRYGMFLADNGSDWYVSGAPDARWDDENDLNQLKGVPANAFEVVKLAGAIQR